MEQSISTHQTRHIQSYDFLRVFALLGVLLYHLFPSAFPGGYFGVILFFVLAGFLTARNLCLSYRDTPRFALVPYYRRRLERLWPPVLFLVFVTLIWAFCFQNPLYFSAHNEAASAVFGYNNFQQMALHHSYFDLHRSLSPFKQIWALSVEAQFYLLFSPLIKVLREKTKLPFSGIGAILVLLSLLSALYAGLQFQVGIDPSPIYYSLLARSQSFLLSAGLSFLFFSSPLPKKFRCFSLRQRTASTLCLLGLVILLAIPFFFMAYHLPFVYRGGMWLYAALACVFLMLAESDLCPAWMRAPFIMALSRRSYAIYLWQYTCMIAAYDWFSRTTVPRSWALVIGLLTAALMSELSYRLFEKKRPARGRLPQTVKIASLPAISLREAASVLAAILILNLLWIMPVSATSQRPRFDEDALRHAAIHTERERNRAGESAKHAQNSKPSAKPSSTPGTSASNSTKPSGSAQPSAAPSNTGSGQALSAADKALLHNLPVTMIGDSVLEMARPYLTDVMAKATVDAQVSRQLGAAIDIMQDMKTRNELAPAVVIALGTNGVIYPDDFDNILKEAGNRQLFFVNTVVPSSWEVSVNNDIAAFVKKHPNCYLVDWYHLAKEKPDWFYDDQTHPIPSGAQIYANLLMAKIAEANR